MLASAVFVIASEGAWAIFTCTVSVPVTVVPLGDVAVTLAVLLIAPESMSVWVVERVAMQVMTPLGAKVAGRVTVVVPFLQVIADRPTSWSFAVTPANVVLPVLVRVKV